MIISKNFLKIVMKEVKNLQILRILKYLVNRVLDLKGISFRNSSLDNLNK